MTSPNDTPSSPDDQPVIPGLELLGDDTNEHEGVAQPTALELAQARAPFEDRISEAQAELGGGIASAEQRSTERHLLGLTLINYSQSLHYKSLFVRGASDREVKREGGVRKCQELAKAKLLAARKAYLDSQGLPSTLPDSPTDEQRDAYYAGVSAWANFRQTVLQDAESRAELARELSVDVS